MDELLEKKLSKALKSEREKTIYLASTDIITTTNTPLSPLSLFGVIFNFLSTSFSEIDKNFDIETEEGTLAMDRIRAGIHLLGIISPFVNGQLLGQFLGRILEVMEGVFRMEPPAEVLIPGVDFVANVLNAVPVSDFTRTDMVKKVFEEVLVLVVEGRPKVRKRAINCVVKLFKVPPKAALIADTVTEYAVSVISECKPQATIGTLYILELLKNIVGNMPNQNQKVLCENILMLPNFGQMILTTKSLLFFKNLFLNTEEYSPIVIQLVRALMDSPSLTNLVDPDAVMASADTFCVGFKLLANLKPELFTENILLLVDKSFAYLEYENKAANRNVCRYLGDTLKNCMSSGIVGSNSQTSKLPAIIEKFRVGLTYTYGHTWNPILRLIADFFQSLIPFSDSKTRPFFQEISHELLQNLLALRRENYAIFLIDEVLGNAIKALGLNNFLISVPMLLPTIDYDPQETVINDNLWLLPLLRKTLERTELAFFGEYFLPMADQLTKNSEMATFQDSLIIASQLNFLIMQIWDTFPNFCTYPKDISSFKTMAKRLCDGILSENTEISKNVVSGIQNLINTNESGDLSEVSQFSKNFLPNLFNKFLSDLKRTERQLVYNGIESFLSIAEPALVNKFFTEVSTRLLKETMSSNEGEKVERYLDLLSAFIPHITMENVELLYKTTEPMFSSKDPVVQKRALKVLLKMCDTHHVLIETNLEQIITILSGSISQSKTSKFARLQLIALLLESHTDPSVRLEILKVFILEIVLFVKDVNRKARDLSVEILVKEARFYNEIGEVAQFINLLLALLTFDTPVIPSTLLAMEHVIRDTKFDRSLAPALFSTSVTLLQSPSTEILTSTLGLFKILVRKCEKQYLQENLEDILKTLMTFGTLKIRMKHTTEIKLILVKMMRRVDPKDVVLATAPKYKKFVNNVRKTESRNQRDLALARKAKSGKKNKNDDDESLKLETYETDLMNVDGGEVQKQGLWIMENQTDDDVLDFLSADATKHIVSSIPGLEAKSRKRKLSEIEDVEYDEYGRMIIEESDDMDEAKLLQEERFAKRQRIVPKKKFVKERNREATGKHSGVGFKAKSGKGDVLKKDKLEPYAYIKLDPSQLNKRRRHVAYKKFAPITNTKKGKRR